MTIELAMKEALRLASEAFDHQDVPVGAVVLNSSGKIIGQGKNERELHQLVSRHAEVCAIENACRTLENWNLTGCDLVVSLEPCLMCTGMIIQSRIRKVWYACPDPKGGAIESTYKVGLENLSCHPFDFQSGPLAQESQALLQRFFKELRAGKKSLDSK